MSEIAIDRNLVAKCGLYCGACGKYLNGKCPGCAKNEKATWCQVRSCNLENGWSTCAECTTCADPNSCGKYNNFISRMVGFILKSDRSRCIALIKEKGLEGYAAYMAEHKQRTLPREKRGR